MYVFILNISIWAYLKIKMAEFMGIFSWKKSILNAIKTFDTSASEIKVFRSWPTNYSIQRILNS
jgi:nicotinamide mononucleotide adenylyltransferase